MALWRPIFPYNKGDAAYGQVKLTMGNLGVGLLESPDGWDQRQNDAGVATHGK